MNGKLSANLTGESTAIGTLTAIAGNRGEIVAEAFFAALSGS
jgi:hypothetical protein